MEDLDVFDVQPQNVIAQNNFNSEMAQPIIATSSSYVTGSVNLLDWDDSSSTNVHPVVESVQTVSTVVALQDYIPDIMSPQLFQSQWLEWAEHFNGQLCQFQSVPAITEVEAALRNAKVSFFHFIKVKMNLYYIFHRFLLWRLELYLVVTILY